MSNANEPAYPEYFDNGGRGLTKRELIAAMAMQGLCANSDEQLAKADGARIAEWAVTQADALLAQLSKEPSHEGG